MNISQLNHPRNGNSGCHESQTPITIIVMVKTKGECRVQSDRLSHCVPNTRIKKFPNGKPNDTTRSTEWRVLQKKKLFRMHFWNRISDFAHGGFPRLRHWRLLRRTVWFPGRIGQPYGYDGTACLLRTGLEVSKVETRFPRSTNYGPREPSTRKLLGGKFVDVRDALSGRIINRVRLSAVRGESGTRSNNILLCSWFLTLSVSPPAPPPATPISPV